MGADTTTSTSRELLIRIAEKQDRMNVDIKEIKETIKEIDNCQERFQLNYTQEHERVVNTAGLAHKRIDEVLVWKYETEKRIKLIEEALVSQKTINKILVFISSVLGSAVIMYIWDVLINH